MKTTISIAFIMLMYTATFAQEIQLGNYTGNIGISYNASPVNTKLEIKDGKIRGTYSYGINNESAGKFTNCTIKNHTLSCDWIESIESVGSFKAIFNSDYSSFIGVWYYADGRYGGAWLGNR